MKVRRSTLLATTSFFKNPSIEELGELMLWNVYLSGEIHTAWRDEIIALAQKADLNIKFTSPMTDHSASDDCGTTILGPEENKFWHDHKSAKLNAMRTRKAIQQADLVVVRFGEKYRQWNAAFDAGYATALGKSLIVIHEPEHGHALKEIDAAALAVAQNTKQVVEIFQYVVDGKLAVKGARDA